MGEPTDVDYGPDRIPAQTLRLVSQAGWDYRDALTRFKPFASLDEEDLVDVFARLELVTVPDGTDILEQGQPCQSIFFIVTGRFVVRADDDNIGKISSGDHFGAEALHATIRRFQRGETGSRLFGGSPAAATVTAMGPCKCLALSTQDVRIDVLKKLSATTFSSEYPQTDSEQLERQSPRRNSAAGVTIDTNATGELTLQSLKAQRDDLLVKVRTAKLLAMREQLAEQMRLQEAQQPAPAAQVPQRACMRRSNSDNAMLHRGKQSQPSAPVEKNGLVAEKARLEAQLSQLLQKEFSKDATPVEPALATAGVTSDPPVPRPKIADFKSFLHPFLRGVIPIPMKGSSDNLHGDRTKWGAVWENSYYFCHDLIAIQGRSRSDLSKDTRLEASNNPDAGEQVYRKNVPKKGIPVDTNGNGIVDSLAVDFTGDGRVDTIIKDEHSEQVALNRTRSEVERR